MESHTLQRSGSLKAIADNGHVLTYRHRFTNGAEPLLNTVGIRKASTFPGFCACHDSTTFSPIETVPFVASRRQCFLVAYRSYAYEYYSKLVAKHSQELRDLMVRGRSFAAQRDINRQIDMWNLGVSIACGEMAKEKDLCDKCLVADDFNKHFHYVVHFDSPPHVVCSGIFNPEYSCSGRQLLNMADLSEAVDRVAFNLIHTANGGAAIFTWSGLARDAIREFVESLIQIADDELPSLLTLCAFDWLENIFISPTWWSTLDDDARGLFNQRFRMNMPFSSPAVPARGHTSLVTWKVVERTLLA